MLPDRVSNPGPLTYESGALPIALPGPALHNDADRIKDGLVILTNSIFDEMSCTADKGLLTSI